MSAVTLTSGEKANLGTGALVGRFSERSDRRPNGRSLFPAVMKAARTWWRSHHAAELAAIIGCDVRSAERYLAGHRTADAEALLAILTSEHGAKLIEVATAAMPADRRERFWNEMGKAAKRADIHARQDALARELTELDGR